MSETINTRSLEHRWRSMRPAEFYAEILERRMTVAWSLHRNTDKALPASQTIKIKFNLHADFPGGGIADVPGILMAQVDQVRGSPLSGLAVNMTDGFSS
jgi:hypothetical protein